jgi:2-iminobutanoate/2-iminopropanoate deaminase
MSENLQLVNPQGMPAPLGPYSHVGSVQGGAGLVFISGQVGADADGVLVDPSDFRLQVRQAFKNLEAMLASMQLGVPDIAFLRGFLTRNEDFDAIREERARWYAQVSPASAPPCSFVVVRGLYHPDCLFEVDAVAVRP